MKQIWLFLLAFGAFACGQNPQKIDNQRTDANYLRFQFSQRMASTAMADASNWCAAGFGETALIGADPKNYFRRLFALSDIPCRVIVDYGNISAALMLHKTDKGVEVLTSENLPACLSNRANFQISPEGTSFRYDNKREISFDVYLQELSSGIQIALDLPTNGGYGMSVVRCEGCK